MCEYKGGEIIEAEACPDHIHLLTIELTAEIRVVIDKATATVKLGEDEYIAPSDGLIYCRKCNTPRQTVIRSPFRGYIAPRRVCHCQQEDERHRRETEERRQRMDRIRRRKAQGLQDRYPDLLHFRQLGCAYCHSLRFGRRNSYTKTYIRQHKNTHIFKVLQKISKLPILMSPQY